MLELYHNLYTFFIYFNNTIYFNSDKVFTICKYLITIKMNREIEIYNFENENIRIVGSLMKNLIL